MAIRDLSKKPFIDDRNERVAIGIDLPFRKANTKHGWFSSTETTIEAVKNNIRNLVNTHKGERLLQPNIGLDMRKFLFQQMNEDLLFQIEQDISDTINFWLPFVKIENINIQEIKNTIRANIIFKINKSPDSISSLQLNIVEINSDGMTTTLTSNEAISGGDVENNNTNI